MKYEKGNMDKTSKTEDNPYVSKTKSGYEITPAGQEFLQAAVTDTADNVYAFTDQLSPTTIAAAMARLSRRGDDMRVTILDEFAAAQGKDRKSTRLNSSHLPRSRMPSSA